MRKWINLFLALVMIVMCSMTMVVPAYAEELPALPEVYVPVEISISGPHPYYTEDYVVRMEPDDASYPMPEGTVDGVCSLTITGEGTDHFPAMVFNRVGIYTYKVYQLKGSNDTCSYDKTVYSLKVTITNNEDYTGFEATAVLYPDSGKVKRLAAEFDNKYTPGPAEPVPVVPAGEIIEDEQVPLAQAAQTGSYAPLLLALCLLSGIGIILLNVRREEKEEKEE